MSNNMDFSIYEADCDYDFFFFFFYTKDAYIQNYMQVKV